MSVYIFGFPFGDELALGEGESAGQRRPRATVSKLSGRGEDDDGSRRLLARLVPFEPRQQLAGPWSMLGEGSLVSPKSTIRARCNIGSGDPRAPELLAMLDGTASAPFIEVAPNAAGGRVRLHVDVPLLDPLGRSRIRPACYTSGTAKFSRKKRPQPALSQPAPGNDNDPSARDTEEVEPAFTFGPIEGARSLPLAIDHAHASGTLELPLSGLDRDPCLWGQVAYVNGSGQTLHTRPSRYLISAVNSANAERKAGEARFLGEVIDPDNDCDGFAQAGRNPSCEVPGTLHDLNIDIAVTNAPRIVRAMDGDFAAIVHVAGSFDPVAIRTRTQERAV